MSSNEHLRLSENLLCLLAVIVCVASPTTLVSQDAPPANEQFIPADQLDAVFDRDRRGVMMSRGEFRKLLETARANAAASKHPIPIISERAAYTVTQGEHQAQVRLEFTVRQFADGWQVLRIPAGNLMIETLEVDGQPALISRDAADPTVVLLAHETAGTFTVTATASTPLATAGSDRTAAFQLLQIPAVELSVDCPAGRQLLVNDLKLNRPAADDADATYSVPVGAAADVRLRWVVRRAETESQMLVFVQTDARLQVQKSATRWESDSRVSVFGGSINRLVASVPSSLEITSVESSGLESWTLDDDPDNADRTRVTLTYRQPFTNDRLVKIRGVALSGDELSQRIPTLQFVDVTSHSGRLLVTSEDGLRLMSETGGGVRRVTASDLGLPGDFSVFDFWQQSFDLRVGARPRDRELFAESTAVLAIDDTRLSLTAALTVETLNAPLFELLVTLPADWQLQSVTTDEQPVPWTATSDPSVILVRPAQPVAPGQMLAVALTLTRTIADPDVEQRLAWPVVQAKDVTTVGGSYVVRFADDLVVAPLTLTGLNPVSGSGAELVFQNLGTVVTGELSIARRPSRVAGRTVLRTWADSRTQSLDAEIIADVLSGTIRTLTVRMSESLGPEVRFAVRSVGPVPGLVTTKPILPVTIIEQSAGAVAEGLREFQLKLDKRFAGSLILHAFVQRPRTNDAPIAAPIVQIKDAVRQHGVLAFEASPEQQLTVGPGVAQIPGLFVADAGLVDPPAAETGRRLALTYRFVQPGYAFDVTESRFATSAVPSAVCELLANVCTLNDAGGIQRWTQARVRSSGVQTLRFTLPDADRSFLWSTMLNGEPVEVRRDGADYLVALGSRSLSSGGAGTGYFSVADDAVSEAPGDADVLTVLFETAADRSSAFSTIEQRPLSLAIDVGDQQAIPIDVLQQTWTVYYPQSSMLVDSDGQFRAQNGFDQPGWLVALSQLTWPDGRQLLAKSIPMIVFLLVLFVLTVMVQRKRWKSLAAVCGVGVVASLLLLQGQIQNPRAYSRYTDANRAEAAAAAQYEAMAKSETDSPMPSMMAGEGGAAMGGFGGGGMAGMGMGGMPPAGPGGMRAGINFNAGDAAVELSAAPAAPLADVAVDRGGEARSGGERFRQITPPVVDDAPRDNFSRPLDGLAATDPSAAAPQSEEAPANQQAGGQFGLGGQIVQGGIGGGRLVPQRGSARLSVNVKLDVPDGYRSREFTSVADAMHQPSVLGLVVQKRGQIAAIRLIAALIVVLIGWRLRRTPLLWRLTIALIAALAAFGVMPLVANAWQSALDGVVFGAIAAAVIAVVSEAFLNCSNDCCWTRCWRWFSSAPTASSVLMLIVSSVSAGTAHAAQMPDEIQQPDVIVPYSPDQPALRSDRVFIRHDDFLKLYQQAYPNALTAPAAGPVGSQVVASYFKTGDITQVDGTRHIMAVTARFVAYADSDMPASIWLPIGPVGIQSVTVDGKPGAIKPLTVGATGLDMPNFNAAQIGQMQQMATANSVTAATDGPAYAVELTGKGAHVVDVSFAIPAVIEGELGRMDLPLRSPATGLLEWTLPADDLEARVNGRTNTGRRDGRVVLIPVAQSSTLRLTWLPRVQKAAGDVVFHSSTRSAMSLQDAGITIRTTIEVTCRQGEISELDVTIPEGYSMQSVSGDDVAGWDVQNTDATRSVRLQLRRSVGDNTKVTLQLFAVTPPLESLASLPVPISMVRGAGRDLGSVTFRCGPQFQVRSDVLSGVSQMNPGEAQQPDGDELSGRPMLAWRYTRHPASVAVKVTPASDELAVTAFHAVRLEEQRQLWSTRATLKVSGAPRSRIDLAVPRSFLALDVTATGLKDWYYSDDDQADSPTRTLSLLLHDARSGTLQLALQGQMNRDADRSLLSLQPPTVLSASTAQSELAVWLDAASESAGLNATGDWTIKPVTAADLCFREIAPTSPSLAFHSSAAHPGALSVRLRQAVSTLIAETVTVINVTENATEMLLALNWQIARAAADQFAVELPTPLASIMAFDVPGLRQVSRTDLGNGRTRVTIRLQQAVTDRLFGLGTASLPLPADRVIRPDVPNVVIPDGSPSTLSGQSHVLVLVNQSGGLLQPTADQSADDVAAEQIATRLPPELLAQAVSIRKLHSGTAAWNLVYPEAFQVAPAVVTLASHVTVLSDDGSWRSRHQLQVTNESRQFLPVQLPAGSRLMYCRVQGRPSRVVVRGDGEAQRFLIPIPQAGALAAAFDVEFALAGRFDESVESVREQWSSERLLIPVPVFPEFRDDPEFGISVSRNRWTVYVPESWRASLVTDPDASNVVAAEVAALEDAALLSYVEQASTLLKSASAAKGAWFKGRAVQQLQQVEQTLRQQRGNDSSNEAQRADAVSKLNGLWLGLSAGAEGVGVQVQSEAFGNGYLLEQDLNQNFQNIANCTSIMSLNCPTDPQAAASVSGAQPGTAFRFSLDDGLVAADRELMEKDKQLRNQLGELEQKKEAESLDRRAGAKADEESKAGRSQLLQRRSRSEEQPGNAIAGAELLAVPADAAHQPDTPAIAPAQQPMDQDNFFGMAVPSFDEQAQQSLQGIQRVATPTGLLSLNFEIPTDGVRLDFLRVGGNPQLSLDVRSSRAVSKGVGLLWAGLCLVGIGLIIMPGCRGQAREFTQRLCGMLAIAGLVAWLLVSGPIQAIGLPVCVICSIVFAATIAFRRA